MPCKGPAFPFSQVSSLRRHSAPISTDGCKADAERYITVDGPELAALAIRAGLVDKFQMNVRPVVVGSGKRFFPDGVRLDLEVVEERRFRRGAVIPGTPSGADRREGVERHPSNGVARAGAIDARQEHCRTRAVEADMALAAPRDHLAINSIVDRPDPRWSARRKHARASLSPSKNRSEDHWKRWLISAWIAPSNIAKDFTGSPFRRWREMSAVSITASRLKLAAVPTAPLVSQVLSTLITLTPLGLTITIACH